MMQFTYRSLRKYILIFLTLLLLLPSYGCTNTPAKTDIPSISQNEACAIVRNYLQQQLDNSKFRVLELGTINTAAASFSARYIGNGQWAVYSSLGSWYVYEKSGIVEPGDKTASDLLWRWQFFKK